MLFHRSAWRDYTYVLAGTFILALGVVLFLSPNQIATGSTTGLAIVLHHLLEWPLGLLLALVNLPLLLLGLRVIGWRFTVRTVIAVLLVSFFANALSTWSGLPVVTQDLFLASVYGGMVVGLGVGLTYKGEASAGGGGIVAKIVAERSFFTLGQVLLAIDVLVIAFSGLVFQNVESAFYAGIGVFVTARTVDLVLTGAPFAKTVLITTAHANLIGPAIKTHLELPVTVMQTTSFGEESGSHVISVLANAQQITRINSLVKERDPAAVTVVSNASEIIGQNV